jgi:hypothetical protein
MHGLHFPLDLSKKVRVGGGNDYLGINQSFQIYPKMNSSTHMNMNNISMWVLEGESIWKQNQSAWGIFPCENSTTFKVPWVFQLQT